MSYPSRPNWKGNGTRWYTALFSFDEHLPIHTQTVGAMHLGPGRASYFWEGESGANFLTSHDSIIVLSVYILPSGGGSVSFVFFVPRIPSIWIFSGG